MQRHFATLVVLPSNDDLTAMFSTIVTTSVGAQCSSAVQTLLAAVGTLRPCASRALYP